MRSSYPSLKRERYCIFLLVGGADPLRISRIVPTEYICNKRIRPGAALDQGVLARTGTVGFRVKIGGHALQRRY